MKCEMPACQAPNTMFPFLSPKCENHSPPIHSKGLAAWEGLYVCLCSCPVTTHNIVLCPLLCLPIVYFFVSLPWKKYRLPPCH